MLRNWVFSLWGIIIIIFFFGKKDILMLLIARFYGYIKLLFCIWVDILSNLIKKGGL